MDSTNEINKITFKSFFTLAGIPGYVLLLRTIVMALISRQRDVSEVTIVDSSAMIQILLAILAFVAALYIFYENKICMFLLFNSPLKWLFYYNIWAFVSVVWSDDPMMTAYRAFETMAYLLLLCAVLVQLYSRLTSVELLIKWVLYYAVFAILVGVLNRFRQFGMDIFSLDNLLLEQMGSTPYFFLAMLLPVGLLIKAIILPISIFSLSNTAYAGMAGGLLALLKGEKWVKVLFFIFTIGLIAALLTIGPETILKKTIFYGKDGIGLDQTTGRDKIAELSWNKAIEKPFTGYGFVAGEISIITKNRPGVIGAHNGLLSALLGTGFFGAILLLIFFAGMLTTANSNLLTPQYHSAFLASVILIAVHTMGNPGIGSRVYGTWIPAVLIFTLISIVHLHSENQQ